MLGDFRAEGGSFEENRNESGPNTDPFGTLLVALSLAGRLYHILT